MTSLQPYDDHLHHADGSHRHTGGPADMAGIRAYGRIMAHHLWMHRWPIQPGQVRLLAQPVPVPRVHQPANR